MGRILVTIFVFASLTAGVAQPVSSRFQFKEPHPRFYRTETNAAFASSRESWIRAWPDRGSTNGVAVSSQVVLHLKNEKDFARVLAGRNLTLARTFSPGVFILQAGTPLEAMREAENFSRLAEVQASYPVMRRSQQLHGPYLFKPTDPYFQYQWHLEQRNYDGSAAGMDLNVRAAWPLTRGEGILIGVADDGIELTHADLASRVGGAPHFNFGDGTTNVAPTSSDAHATAVAGLIAANLNNQLGCAGVAPGATMASWKIFTGSTLVASDVQLADMFQYQSNIVSVENHSWGFGGATQDQPSLLEYFAISNAVTFGRGGRGVVICRSAGNSRLNGGNANDDGYPSNPKVIAVAAARIDGRAASYSNPGACLLVGAPSGDTGFQTLFTTERTGSLGYNQISYTNDLADYCFDSFGFSGTSGAAPQITGIAALILAANTNLNYRDVQQILIFSSRHFDLADPDVRPNGAGFLVSHNLGFGIPDAGAAVNLARIWKNRPAVTNISFTATNVAAIPDAGLRILVHGTNSAFSSSIIAKPSLGLHPDDPTAILPLIDVGLANDTITNDLHGKAALIQRGGSFFYEKIQRAADAGASFAIIYNNATGNGAAPGGDFLVTMGATDFVPIPAVFIGETAGENLQSLIQTRGDIVAQLHLDPVNYSFSVTNTVLCEHVALRVQTDHTRRSDVRITLTSPSGTRSVLQRFNNDLGPGPVDWTYYSTHHFYESSAGVWTVSFSDELEGETGNVQLVSLNITGVPITDVDADGLDDAWEMARFGSLAAGPTDDPDRDGLSNMREQILGTDPHAFDFPLQLNLSRWNDSYARLSWSGSSNFNYEVRSGARDSIA